MSKLTKVTAPQELTDDEIRLVMAYRSLSDRRRELALLILPAWIETSLRRTTPAPTGIRLVAAAGKRVAA